MRISPPKQQREALGRPLLLADERLVRAADTHSAEISLLLWNIENFIRQTLSFATDHPEDWFRSSDGNRLDIIQVLHMVKRRFRDIRCGRANTFFRSSREWDSLVIVAILDGLRYFINGAKHLRTDGAIYGSDILSLGNAANLARSALLLTCGTEDIFSTRFPTAVPRFHTRQNTISSRGYTTLLEMRPTPSTRHSTVPFNKGSDSSSLQQ
jgi:hypothetical protein